MALALGVNHPDILENVLSTKQLVEWEIFYALESFGEKAEWERIASILCFYVNANKKEGSTPSKIEDFMPEKFVMRKKQQQTVYDMKSVLDTLMNRKKK